MISWTLSRRIAAGFTIVVALTTAVGVFAVFEMMAVEKNNKELITSELPSIVLLSQIQSTIKGNYINCAQHIEAETPEEIAAIDKEMKDKSAQLTEWYKQVEALLDDEELLAQYETIKKARVAYRDAREQVLILSREGKNEEARKANMEVLYPIYLNYISRLDAQVAINQQRAMAAGEESQRIMTRSRMFVITGYCCAIVLALGTAWLITRRLNRVISSISTQLDEAAKQVSSASGMVSKSSQGLAEGSSEQAASLEETSASLEEVSGMTQRNASSARNAKELSNHTRRSAEGGAADVEAMSKAMDAIKESSNSIAKIIKTIDEIAFQTNILALNAAVEAARAGEAGAGFAVVAEEVRALAQRSANAAKETATNIEDSIMKSGHGVEISGKVAGSLSEIVTKAREVDQLIGEIASGSGEQAQGIQHVLSAVTKIDSVIQGNAATAEEAAAAAEELNSQAIALEGLVGQLQELISGKPSN